MIYFNLELYSRIRSRNDIRHDIVILSCIANKLELNVSGVVKFTTRLCSRA